MRNIVEEKEKSIKKEHFNGHIFTSILRPSFNKTSNTTLYLKKIS